jgi:hypothetical protein
MSTEVKMVKIPNCDLPGHEYPVPAAYDGKTVMGPWAYMCEAHFVKYGICLGTGQGQNLILIEGK